MKAQKELKNLVAEDEIISHITQAAVKQIDGILWRRSGEEILFQYKVRILKISSEELKLEFLEEVEMELLKESEVFFALGSGSLIFKTRVVRLNAKLVTLEIPTKAKGIERRRSPRIKYKLEDKIDMEIVVRGGGKENKFVSYLLNKSEHGLCFCVSAEVIAELEINKVIHIVRGNKEIPKASAHIRNVRFYKKASLNRGELYAVGVEFV